MLQNIPLSIISSDGLQIRVAIDERTVTEYADAIHNGDKLPPVTVFHPIGDDCYFLADGFHRLEACRRLGRKTIKADIRSGSKSDALKFALSANTAHGLRRTNEDKRNAVKVAWENRLALFGLDNPSDGLLAQICGVTDRFVADQVRTIRPCDTSTVVGKDGKTYSKPPMPTRRPKPSSPPPPPPPPESSESPIMEEWSLDATTVEPLDEPPSADIPPPLPPPPPSSIPRPTRRKFETDRLGVEIPPETADTWSRAGELDKLLAALSSVRVALRNAQSTSDKLFREVNFASVLPALDRAYAELAATKPFAVCPICSGYASDGCRACKGRGLLGKDRYYRVVPPDLQRKA